VPIFKPMCLIRDAHSKGDPLHAYARLRSKDSNRRAMKYKHIITLITTLFLLQSRGADISMTTNGTHREGGHVAEYRLPTRSTVSVSANKTIPDTINDIAISSQLYGLHYDHDENSWTLFATVLQLKKTSVYGRPGEIAQIEYSLNREINRYGWIVLRIDDYSFIDEESKNADIQVGQNLVLYIKGEYVSAKGVDWEECPMGDTYCMNASFVDGGLTLCPSNTLIRSGFVSNDWLNGLLAWKIGF